MDKIPSKMKHITTKINMTKWPRPNDYAGVLYSWLNTNIFSSIYTWWSCPDFTTTSTYEQVPPCHCNSTGWTPTATHGSAWSASHTYHLVQIQQATNKAPAAGPAPDWLIGRPGPSIFTSLHHPSITCGFRISASNNYRSRTTPYSAVAILQGHSE